MSFFILKSYNNGNHPSPCTQVSYYNVPLSPPSHTMDYPNKTRRRSEDIRKALYYSRPRFSVTATTGWFVENACNTKLTLCTCCTHTTHMQHSNTMFCSRIHVVLYRLQEPQRDSVLQEGTLLIMLMLVTYLLPELMSQKK